eukprot:TRINITY_DN51245_c0_g3_i1.p1 TRINITY_DN51245_c0_g3~~TRINITY_DN51245_c0_g3_i1.p1  ORF type:complete len:697 (+),score=204.60 TRINITY_DN51245_c0_g3_i1:68-2158(+)
MGANASSPAHVVIVRLQLLSGASQGQPRQLLHEGFYARIHSAADGLCRVKGWGEPQAVGIWTDDVITISLHLASNDAAFEGHQYDDLAELCVPWDCIKDQVRQGQESVFDLGVMTGQPWLGQTAHPMQYYEAFRRSRRACGDGKLRVLRLSLRLASQATINTVPLSQSDLSARGRSARSNVSLPPSSARAAGPGQASEELRRMMAEQSMRRIEKELSAEDRRLLLRLQMENQDLRAHLRTQGDAAAALPDVEVQVQAYIDQVLRIEADNTTLKSNAMSLETELAAIGGQVAERQRLERPSQNPSRQELDPDQAAAAALAEEHEERAADLMAEIQSVTQGNVDLISQYGEHIKVLEADLAGIVNRTPTPRLEEHKARVKQQAEELTAIEEECERLRKSFKEELLRQGDVEEEMLLRRLAMEHEEQRDKIGMLNDELEHMRNTSYGFPPGTEHLEDEMDRVQMEIAQGQHSNMNQQAANDARIRDIRQETQALQEELLHTHAMRSSLEAEVAEGERLAKAAGGSANLGRLQADLLQSKDSLLSEIGRSQRRLDFYDEKIQQLREEADDIRARAQLVWRSVPDSVEHLGNTPDSKPSPGAPDADADDSKAARAVELEGLVRTLEAELEELDEQQESLRLQRTKAAGRKEASQKDQALAREQLLSLEARLQLQQRSSGGSDFQTNGVGSGRVLEGVKERL